MKLAMVQNCQDKNFSLDVLINCARYKEWIADQEVVMIHDVEHDSALGSATYLVIVKERYDDIEDDEESTDPVTYAMYYFMAFNPFDEKLSIQVSVDHQGKTAEEVFALLMTKRYSRGTH